MPMPPAKRTQTVKVHVPVDPGLRDALETLDNQSFIDRLDTAAIRAIPWVPRKTVVVIQDPSPGDQVPAGTSVSVTTAVKTDLPTRIFAQIQPEVATKFPEVRGVIDAVEAHPETRAVLDLAIPYEQLSAAQRTSADAMIAQVFQNPATVSAATKAKTFNDISFLYQL